MKERVETYEQGTGKLLYVTEIDVEAPRPTEMELLLQILETRGYLLAAEVKAIKRP